jgi:hypothetical protein
MPEKNIFSERERSIENEFFLKKEQELIEKMRRRRLLEEDRNQMAEMIGVVDQEVLEALQELGYSAETVMLMPIVPLVQVAWAEDGITEKERESILEIAQARGITPDTPAYQKLIDMLERQPPKEFYDNTLRGLRYLFESMPDDLRALGHRNLVEYCTQIAEASGGILGFRKISDEERLLIARIATEIGQGRAAAVKKVIGDSED